ncbi:MAG: GntR family transcriptional regulator [Terriglobia bacterium]
MIAETAFRPLKIRKTLKDRTSSLVTNAIISGQIKPGERVNESYLARQLHISRAPVREALQQLQEQGLIISIPRRGMFVVSLKPEDIQKINSLRIVLEAEALRLARQHASPQAADKLIHKVKELELLKNAPWAEQVAADAEFHQAIWALSGNEYLEKILNGLTMPLFAHAMLKFIQSKTNPISLDPHRPLLDFVLGTSKQSPEELMLTHLSLRWEEPSKFLSFKHGSDLPLPATENTKT